MAKALIVLSPPSSFPEAFLDFCMPRLQVAQPVLLYFQASLEVCAKKLGELTRAGAIIYLHRWNGAFNLKDYLVRIREEGLRQAQDCVFLLTDEEMDQLCVLEGAETGALALSLNPNSGLQWVLKRSDFQAYLQVKLGEPWRGEPLPPLNLQMHLSVMRESILAGLREELSKQPGDWTAVIAALERQVVEEVKKAAERVEESQRAGLEKVTEAARRTVSEAQSAFEAGRARVERQAQTLVQEQGDLTAVLTEASAALSSVKALRQKVSMYEEANKEVQQILHTLKPAASIGVPVQSTDPPKPNVLPTAPPNVPPKPNVLPNLPPNVPPKPNVQPNPPPNVPPKPNVLHNPPPNVPPKPSVPSVPGVAPSSPYAPKTTDAAKPYGKSGSVDMPAVPKPGALKANSVTIEEIEEAQNEQDQLLVKVNNLLAAAIEGAEIVLSGAPLQPLKDTVPTLPPGRSQFLISAYCLPEDAISASFFLRKDSLPISAHFSIDLGVEEPAALQSNQTMVQSALSKSNSLPPSFNFSAVPKKGENLEGLTAQQTEKYREVLRLLGGDVQPTMQERIRKLVLDPAHAGKSAETLLGFLY